MATLRSKIIEYCRDNSVTSVDFRKDVLLENKSDGNGDFISAWNIAGLAQPDVSTLNGFIPAGNALETLETIQVTRKLAYPTLSEQLDLLYKDMAADKGDKTGEWFKAVKKVKDDNPKG